MINIVLINQKYFVTVPTPPPPHIHTHKTDLTIFTTLPQKAVTSFMDDPPLGDFNILHKTRDKEKKLTRVFN